MATTDPARSLPTPSSELSGEARAGMAAPTVSNPRLARHYLGNRFVYATISQRARGLSIGLNLNPDRLCNFSCLYCDVDRTQAAQEHRIHVPAMLDELRGMLGVATTNGFGDVPCFKHLPEELLELREVAVSGEGEPTLSPSFADAIKAVLHLRAQRLFPFFKFVLITNGTGLHLPAVRTSLRFLAAQDEVWIKLESGTQAYMDRIHRPGALGHGPPAQLSHILQNIRDLGRERSVIIQSLFVMVDGQEPPDEEIAAYVAHLRELKEDQVKIALVQIHSAHQPTDQPDCQHLPLKSLSRIAQRVRETSGLRVEVF